MASCGVGCGSQCQGKSIDASDDANGEAVGRRANVRPRPDGEQRALCFKCGELATLYGNLCASCFRASIFGKFKQVVTSNAMISPTDKVLVAYSGGAASRVVLQFIHDMQMKAQNSWDASKDRSLPVFGVGVAFIDENIFLESSKKVEETVEEIRVSLSKLAPPTKVLHTESIGNIFCANSKDGTDRLNDLLNTVNDTTGKEDLLHHLRMLSLQKIALDNGYNKLVLGSCTTAIACHVISSTVKGQGFSLPADVQYVDARWAVPVVLPLRDCLAEELRMLCSLDGLKTAQILDQPRRGINDLVSSFIARVQEENPSRARTIVRTAEKLLPFDFNKVAENLSYDMLPSRVRRQLKTSRNAESTPSVVLCPICSGPLDDSEIARVKATINKSSRKHEIFAARCCQSCCFQILPKESSSFWHFYSLLPLAMSNRAESISADSCQLRKQIEEFLISSDDSDADAT